jgi:uncharacterized protein (DUF1778 family)
VLDEVKEVNFRTTSKIRRILSFVALIYQRRGREVTVFILNTANIHAEMC